MGNDSSKEWIKISTNYTKNPQENIICPVCGYYFLTVTPVGEDKKVSDIYFHCDKCKAHNIMSIAAPYQAKIYCAIYQDDEN